MSAWPVAQRNQVLQETRRRAELVTVKVALKPKVADEMYAVVISGVLLTRFVVERTGRREFYSSRLKFV